MSPETITLRDTLDVIDIRGRDFDTLMLSRGEPIALNWHDCAGTVEQYLVRGGAPDYSTELASLRYLLDGNIQPDTPLTDQVYLFLQLLTAGTYSVSLETAKVSDLIEARTPWDKGKDYDHFYPLDTALVLTQPTDSLSKTRINEFVAQIKTGKRPIVLAVMAEDAWCSYVVDGHHKLVAYRRLNTRPQIITATRLSPPPLPPDTFATWFPAGHPLAAHYSKVKQRDR